MKGLPSRKNPAYWAHSEVTKKMNCCDYNHNTLFSLQLMNGLNKLESYPSLGWKGLPGTNNPAYWAHS